MNMLDITIWKRDGWKEKGKIPNEMKSSSLVAIGLE